MQFSIISRKKELEFPSQLEIGNGYDVVVKEFNKKNSSVIVKGDRIEVRLSSRLTHNQKQRHVDELLNSISKKLNSIPLRKSINFKEVVERGYFICGGRRYDVEWREGRGVKRVENVLRLGKGSKIESLEKSVEKILLNDFEEYIKQRVAFVNSISYNYSYGSVSLKILTSKWGHCTSKNDLLFNLKLVNTSQEVLDYVIYHELAHIKVKNHSLAFWREVERFCPNHKELRKTLKENPPSLYI